MSKSNAHIVLNVRDRTGGQYNAALFNAENQNIIQGDMKSITVSEVNFPYDIPNIQAGFNTFELVAEAPALGSDPGNLTITIAPGFYRGSELADAITTAIGVEQGAVGGDVADAPTVTYDDTTNRFVLVAPANNTAGGNPTPSWAIFSPFTFPVGYQNNTNKLGKDILSIMGYYPEQAGTPPTLTLNHVDADVAAFATFKSGSAPMVFTQYVDICSPQLCKFQYFRDGSTTNLARRSDVICRLYISNNVAILQGDPEGVRPFVINRQFYNARRMRWTADNSIGTIDINLYDDVGQPLSTVWQPRPYQITFNAMENPKDEGMMGGMGRAY